MRRPVSRTYLGLGVSSGCSSWSKSSVPYLDNIFWMIASPLERSEALAETTLHEALHYFDLNTPLRSTDHLSMGCTDDPRPDVCTTDDPPPWCEDHSSEGPWADPPAGLPAALESPCLTYAYPSATSIIRKRAAVDTSDPSEGVMGQAAYKRAIRREWNFQGENQ